MSKQEIAAELARLSQKDRREIARLIFEMESEADVLRECDRAANERFLILDSLEAQDAQAGAS
jgi:hypothetical protein